MNTVSLTRVGNYTAANDYGITLSGEPGYRLERDPDTVRAPDVAWFAPGQDTVRAPDVAWFAPGRLPEGIQGYPELAPDLAVEVKSPSNSNPEMAAKAVMWLSYGSQQVWVEDPEQTTVTIYRSGVTPVTLSDDDILDGGDLLPGFTTPVWRLFRRRR
jgi:Uma2 family endonuclease